MGVIKYKTEDEKKEARRKSQRKYDQSEKGKQKSKEWLNSDILSSNLKIVAQLSRLDTTSNYNSFMTVIGWGENV